MPRNSLPHTSQGLQTGANDLFTFNLSISLSVSSSLISLQIFDGVRFRTANERQRQTMIKNRHILLLMF
jgi:hypothetical protein